MHFEGLLGAGGMAKVYRAKHSILDTHHAIKVLDPEYRANADARGRFLDEAKIQAKHLDHENIVKVTNIVATTEHAALVMELIDGPSLESHVVHLKADPAEIKRIMLGVLAGVGYAHKAGIVHRDLKPANVLLAKRGDVLIPKVTDFGIAKVTTPDDDGKGVKKSTHAAARMGTLSYMSPEQVKRAKDATARSDVFSLGAMLYEMATGEMAFGGDSEYEVMENIVNGRYQPAERRFDNLDPLLASVIRKALETDPADRFASCEEMAGALRGEIKVVNKPAAAPPAKPQTAPENIGFAKTKLDEKKSDGPGSVGRPVESAPSSKKGLVIGLVVGALALGGGALFLALNGKDSSNTASTDGSGSSAMVAPADADVAMGADPDASAVAMATPDATASLQPTTVDASVAVAEVPKPIDAGVAVAPKRVDAGVAVVVTPKRVDAGVARKPDAAVAVASVPADAAVPAKPNPCAGNWVSGSNFQLSFAATGCSGSYKFIDDNSACSGPVRSCRINEGSVVVTFSCTWSGTTNQLDGSLSIACLGSFNQGKVEASLLQGNLATRAWSIGRP